MAKRKWIRRGSIIGVVLLGMVLFGSIAPNDFPTGATVNIAAGSTLNEAADHLYAKGLIRSTILFRIYVTLFAGSAGVKTGEYAFPYAESAVKVAYRLARGDEGFPLVKITIPEGVESRQIGDIIYKAIPGFDETDFIALARPKEGYLFPDTYFWPTNLIPDQAVNDMNAIFNGQIRSAASDIASSTHSFQDIMKMASIVEREASSTSDRRIIAGILWKRLAAGMALQADASFLYILSTSTRSITLDDLKKPSPYNLYLNKGLPPTPIGNPSLDAIEDTADPVATPYWFYLSGRDGITHYAATLDQHNANVSKYLN